MSARVYDSGGEKREKGSEKKEIERWDKDWDKKREELTRKRKKESYKNGRGRETNMGEVERLGERGRVRKKGKERETKMRVKENGREGCMKESQAAYKEIRNESETSIVFPVWMSLSFKIRFCYLDVKRKHVSRLRLEINSISYLNVRLLLLINRSSCV